MGRGGYLHALENRSCPGQRQDFTQMGVTVIDPCRLGNPTLGMCQLSELQTFRRPPPEGWDNQDCMQDGFLQPACLKGVHFF